MASEANRDVKFCDHAWITMSSGDARGNTNGYSDNETTFCLRCGAERDK